MKKFASGLLVCVLVLLLGTQVVWANPPTAGPVVHVVRWGENLTGIARQYGTTIRAIVETNRLTNANRIYAGQRLLIPTATTPIPTPSCVAYTVRYGDTLAGIAYRHGVRLSDVVSANGIVNPNRIYPGQRVAIPCGSNPTPAPPTGDGYYTVRRGDTLAKIALRYGVGVWGIVSANNIANPHVIYPGQRLYIPKATPASGTTKPGCEHLTWPKNGVVVSGVVQARGTADLRDFGYYKLEFRSGGLDGWHYITGAKTPVRNGALGTWDTRTVADGRYLFRLVVVDRMGNYPPPCEVEVQVQNAR